jgi:hypothetical protein
VTERAAGAGTVLPATGTRRLTAAGNACTRDAAAVSLLDVLQPPPAGHPRAEA